MTLTIRLPAHLEKRLNRLAKETHRNQNLLRRQIAGAISGGYGGHSHRAGAVGKSGQALEHEGGGRCTWFGTWNGKTRP